ncbi:hypothetical protein GCM10009546_24480 [Actinomadura livida]|uniref:Uncharacterized protein n=1 Tax=Actinomadura livida TaxID=79909 RepID=A0ABP3PDR7_9ACTN|nr:hypothetical protein GCM10010208_39380 [Actinomadura livida]
MLVVFWETSSGCAASTCAELPRDIPAGAIQRLAQALTSFSAQAWRTYTHPA